MANHQEHVHRAERLRRIMDVYPLVVDGFSLQQIQAVVAGKCSWSVPERTLQRYIAEARALVGEHARFTREEKFAQAAAFLERLRVRASVNGDLARALQVQCELNRLYGLLPPDKHELDGTFALKGYIGMDLKEEG
jgi:hypothetical protein